jgi:hypothetical protein
MSVKQTVNAALVPVLANTHAVELPERPTWPAMVFEIDSQPESGWCLGGGYDQNVVTVVILARELGAIETLIPQVRAAFEPLDGYMGDEEHGDAEYEGDPEIYGYSLNFRIRTPKF